MQISRVHADQRKSLVLFSTGAAICAALELAGVNALSTEKLFPAQIELPFPDLLIMAVVYAVFGIVAGIVSKTKYEAVFYGFSGGQCQFLIPLIIYYGVLHRGDVFQIWLRSLCGIPYMPLFVLAAFGIKYLIKKNRKK